MKTANIIVMGKTGAGKSTLINAVLKKEVAEVGIGQAVTRENKVYADRVMLPSESCEGGYGYVGYWLRMYDTVGLEIDQKITNKTLEDIRDHIQNAKEKMSKSEIYMVWFCVNNRTTRFEDYELRLIRQLSIEYEIPFVIVLTQCIADDGRLDEEIREQLPQIPVRCVLAKDYKIRGGARIEAFGVEKLVRDSIEKFYDAQMEILRSKLEQYSSKTSARIQEIEQEGKKCIEKYGNMAIKAGIVPVVDIPFVHGICIKMFTELNRIAGLKQTEDFVTNVVANIVVGTIVTPFLAVPAFSALAAWAYVETAGEIYLEALLKVIDNSTDEELVDARLVKTRLQKELEKIKKKKR